MKYNTLYKRFIETRSEPTGYYETHHIKPRCLGGTDDPENLIKLTAREHYLAHWMLWKMYPDNRAIIQAFMMMAVESTYQSRRPMPAYLYEKVKLKFSKLQSIEKSKCIWITNGEEERHVDIDEIPDGWWQGRCGIKSFAVDVYDLDLNLVYSSKFAREAIYWINKHTKKKQIPPSVNVRWYCENARQGKSSKLREFYICYAGEKPNKRDWSYMKERNKKIAKKRIGVKRPNHSEFMKKHMVERRDTTSYRFHNTDGRIFIGSRYDLIEEYPNDGLSISELGVLIRGGYKSHRGWKLYQ